MGWTGQYVEKYAIVSKKPASPILVWTLVAVCIACFPPVIVKWASPDSEGHRHWISAGEAKFKLYLETGIVFQSLGRYTTATYWFQKAERSAQQLSDGQYPLLVEAREHLAECYKEQKRNDDAQRTYQSMVRMSMEAGGALSKNDQFAQAVKRFEDAEKFAGNLETSRVAAVQEARARQVGCYFALNKNAEAAIVATRMVETQQELGDPYDSLLAEYYVQLAYARGGSQDWAAAEEAWREAIGIYNAIDVHYSGINDREARAANARFQMANATLNLAATYFNENKMELALSTAESAYAALEIRSPTAVPIELITVGFQSAKALGNRDSEAIWRQRMEGLCSPRKCGQ